MSSLVNLNSDSSFLYFHIDEKDLTEEIEKDLINLLNVGLRIAIKNDLLDESLLIRTNQSSNKYNKLLTNQHYY